MSHDDDHQTPVETEASTEISEVRTEARRKFLKRAGQVAVTTPAVTMLLSAGARQSKAGLIVRMSPIGDGGDTEEDFDQEGIDNGSDTGDAGDTPL